jgi:hypothetical protein
MSKRLGSCGCTCAGPECARRVSAIKEWNGWFAFDVDPSSTLVTTRYLTRTEVLQMEISAAYFDGQNAWAFIEPMEQPLDTSIAFGWNICPDGALVDAYAYNPPLTGYVNVAFYGGGTWERTTVGSMLRDQQSATGSLRHHDLWDFALPLVRWKPG